ncbi:MAG: anhydro-N-acetylmuramic acid kinase [Vampirovibrionales bacterium]|nr:anhydro-N-acetylmuramic acid kinase [Vampirovibrionales bacterium]
MARFSPLISHAGQPLILVGLMSGTSVDGVDACCVKLWQDIPKSGKKSAETPAPLDTCKLKYEILGTATSAIPDHIRQRLLACMENKPVPLKELCSLDNAVGYLFIETAREAVLSAGLKRSDITAIASHGQTIFHMPPQCESMVGNTLQIGNASLMAAQLEIPVVSNFRKRDMALAGQGAPLVCFADQLLFQDDNMGRCVQNIGGIANVTVLPPKTSEKPVIAFDTGPGNMMIDGAMQILFDKPYDDNGEVAASGNSDPSLLTFLVDNPYFESPPPKSTGREEFGKQFLAKILKQCQHLPKATIVATLTRFSARTIADAYHRFVLPETQIQEVILGGGGAFNATLKKMLAEELSLKGHTIAIKTHQDFGIPDQYKEALAFAILGWATLLNIPGNIPSCTGAQSSAVLGCLDF